MRFEPAILPPSHETDLAWSFCFAQGQLLLPDGEAALRPGLPPEGACRHYLGRLAGLDVWAQPVESIPPGWRGLSLRAAMTTLPAAQTALAGRAAQVLEWDRSHRFCGVCGTPTTLVEHERARRCPSCGQTAYPRIAPAMMVLIWRPGEVMLARSPRFTPGMYSALAGFVEAGETLEQCVQRETAEEVGLAVGDLRYYGSQSWPFPHSLMVAFTARWVDGDILPQPEEIEHAAWFALNGLPDLPPRFSIAGHLIRDSVAALADGRLA